MPARNMELYIAETCESICCQTSSSFEVVCIDDGSTDGTRKILTSFAQRDDRFKIVNGPARGVSAARNLGLSLAKGQFVLFLDADDILHPEALKAFYLSLANSRAVGSLTGVQRINVDGKLLPGADNRLLVPRTKQLDVLLQKNFVVNGGALALRIEYARQCGGYDEDLSYGEDWEFWCRIALLGDINVVEGPSMLFYRQVASGANFKANELASGGRYACIQKIKDNPSIQKKFGFRLRLLLRFRQIDIFWSSVRNQYQYGRKLNAVAEGICGIFRYPDSIFRPYLIWRFLSSLDRRT